MNEQRYCPHCGKPVGPSAPGGICPACMIQAGAHTGEATEPGDGESSPSAKPTPAPPLTPEEVAKYFPQLEIVECLGRGGMGVVYKARQPKLNRWVALKILAPERGATAHFAERFEREAQALARLNHPNIISVHDFGESGGLFYLLMEYADGLNLRQLLRSKKMSPEEALTIVPPICDALQYAHQHGIVHRDIKPENVLLQTDGQVKIADFGIAKILKPDQGSSTLTEERQVIGTPHYMAPEQVETPSKVDHRADIYSLGVIFYEMLTGELPLGKFAPPSSRLRGLRVDVRLDEVVLHALEKEPDRRYQQASEVKDDVETITAASVTASVSGHAAPVSSSIAPPPIGVVRAVRWPAVGWLATALFSPFLPGIGIMTGILEAGPWMLFPLIFVIAATVVTCIGAVKLLRLESYRWALTGAVVGCFLSFFNLFCLPFVIWSLYVLTRPDVKAALGRATRRSQSQAAAPEPMGRGSYRGARNHDWVYLIVKVVVIGFAVLIAISILSIIVSLVMPVFSRSHGNSGATTPTRYSDAEMEISDQGLVMGSAPSHTRGTEPPPAATSEATPRQRHYVRLVFAPDAMTFQGNPTSWKELGDRLGEVENRPQTVFEMAITTETFTISELNVLQSRTDAIAREFDFEYMSYIGVHPLGSPGSPSVAISTPVR